MITPLMLLAAAAACLLNSTALAAGTPDRAKMLIAVLQSDAGLFEKARACQQLGEIGDKEAVPALAALLGDAHLSAYARSGLEGIPDPSAAEVLLAAAGALKGNLRAGVINSLGVLRVSKATALLMSLAANPESGAAKEALLALGRIATDESSQFLRRTLADGTEALRPDTAAACLLAAEKQLADGRMDAAAVLYDAVRTAKVPAPCRAAATRGAILARKSAGPAFLIEQLRSDERVIRDVALMTIREMPGDSLAAALNAELEKAKPELQTQLLIALADCHNPQSSTAVKSKVASDDPVVRKTALVVLGQIGGPADAGVFLQAVMNNRNDAETGIALSNLGRMEGADVDHQIMQALSSGSEAATRIRLIRLVGARGMTNATAELFKQAADPDAKVRVAAIEALKAVAGPGELPALIAYTRSCADETVRETAEAAIVSLCLKSANPQAEAELVLVELERATKPAERKIWLSILASLGCAKALPILKADLGNANDEVAANAIAQLGRWPDPTPIDALLVVVESGPDPVQRKHALDAAIHLATAAADEHQRTDDVIVEWLRRADKAAQTVEARRLILSALGRLSSMESFRLLARHLEDAGLENEAAIAIIQIAPALAQQGNAAEVKEVLAKLAVTAKNADIRQKARKGAAIP
jgi:HEAT repeat protein